MDSESLATLVEVLECASRTVSVITVAKRMAETDNDQERIYLAQALQTLCEGGHGRRQIFGQAGLPSDSQYQH
jgi:hypothetical protein